MKNPASISLPARTIRGHHWRPEPAICPQVLTVVDACYPLRRELRHLRNAHWVLDYNYSPMGRGRAGKGKGLWHPRRQPTAHLYRPGLPYQEDLREQAGRVAHSGYFIFTGGTELGLDRALGKAGYARYEDPAGRLGDAIRNAANLPPGANARPLVQAALWQVAAMLHEAMPVDSVTYRIPAVGETPLPPPSLVDRVRSILQQHLAQQVTLHSLARHLSVSPSTLTHTYRRQCGETPMASLRRLRIELARALLLKGMPLKTIAAQTGFADAFHLSRTFKREEGLTPREYRRQAQSLASAVHRVARSNSSRGKTSMCPSSMAQTARSPN